MLKWYYFVGGILAAVGLSVIITSSVLYGRKGKRSNVTVYEHWSPEFGIVFDAGGSGTRMYVYEFVNNTTPVQKKFMECEDKGLTRYPNVDELVAPLKKCLKAASEIVPRNQAYRSPIWLEATAGMRMLGHVNKSQHDLILSKVNSILSNGSYPVKLVRTMSGMEEASHSWSTINQLIKKNSTDGLLEMGSSSMQIAFVPEDADIAMPSRYTDHVTIGDKKHRIYVHSYLCFGKNEFVRRYYGKLLHDSNYTDVKDPCSFAGFSVNRTAADIFQAPCVRGEFAEKVLGGSYNIEDADGEKQFLFTGTSNYSMCYQKVDGMFSKQCDKTNCVVNNAFQPPANGPFYAIGSAMYYSALFAGVTGKTNETDIEEAVQKLCNSNFEQVRNMSGFSPEFSMENCLADTFIVYILKDILRYKDDITFAKEISGNKLSWTLGAAAYHANNGFFADKRSELGDGGRGLEDSVFIGVLVVGILLVLLGVILIILMASKSSRRSIKSVDTEMTTSTDHH